jgi:glutathione S-transferase
MLAVSHKGTVPVLVLKDQVLEESLDIINRALQQSDPQSWSTAGTAPHQDAVALVHQCDSEFKQHLDRYKYPNRYDLPDGLANRQQGSLFLSQLNVKLSQTACLMGPAWCWVDAAIAPFVRQFARTDRAWFDAQAWKPLQNWLTSFEDSDAYAQVMHKYKVWHQDAKPVAYPATPSMN